MRRATVLATLASCFALLTTPGCSRSAEASPCLTIGATSSVTASPAPECRSPGVLAGLSLAVPQAWLKSGVQYADDDVWSSSYVPHERGPRDRIRDFTVVLHADSLTPIRTQAERQAYLDSKLVSGFDHDLDWIEVNLEDKTGTYKQPRPFSKLIDIFAKEGTRSTRLGLNKAVGMDQIRVTHDQNAPGEIYSYVDLYFPEDRESLASCGKLSRVDREYGYLCTYYFLDDRDQVLFSAWFTGHSSVLHLRQIAGAAKRVL